MPVHRASQSLPWDVETSLLNGFPSTLMTRSKFSARWKIDDGRNKFGKKILGFLFLRKVLQKKSCPKSQKIVKICCWLKTREMPEKNVKRITKLRLYFASRSPEFFCWEARSQVWKVCKGCAVFWARVVRSFVRVTASVLTSSCYGGTALTNIYSVSGYIWSIYTRDNKWL